AAGRAKRPELRQGSGRRHRRRVGSPALRRPQRQRRLCLERRWPAHRPTAASDYNGPPEVKIWDVAAGKEVLTLTGVANPVTGLAFSPVGWSLVLHGQDQSARVWSTQSGKQVCQLQGTTITLTDEPWSPDSK